MEEAIIIKGSYKDLKQNIETDIKTHKDFEFPN